MKRFPRASGVLLHITSLPGPHGSGDFGPDAYYFVDWLVGAGQSLWQILPLGGIGLGNSPYMSSSAFAGNVLMIDLGELARQGLLGEADLQPDARFAQRAVDFAAVVPYRLERLQLAATRFAAGATPQRRAEFGEFCARHSSWLDDYALFMTLAERFPGCDWCDWDPALASRDPSALEAAALAHGGRINFWKFCQWCFFSQFARLRRYANERGVSIVGDAPIFIAHHSADAWSRRELFQFDGRGRPSVVAGVPPDYFSVTGQRWGNPLYRWERMAAEGYRWWVDRVRRALAHADVFRIDHFRGFAGYWEVPASCPTAIEGRWVTGPGRALFDAIEAELGALPIVAEDLGLVTADVEELRDGLGLPGMRILQFGFSDDATHAFLPHNYVRNTVVYTGTHDNDTARGWWDAAPQRERAFAGSYLHASARDIHWGMIRAASASVANLAIFPLQDVLGLDGRYRMNVPGVMGNGNWTWRFDWRQVGAEPARVLGLITAACGRGPMELLHLPNYVPRPRKVRRRSA